MQNMSHKIFDLDNFTNSQIHFWLRQELKESQCSFLRLSVSVCLVQVCLELLIFTILAQVSLYVFLQSLSALSLRSLPFLGRTDGAQNTSCLVSILVQIWIWTGIGFTLCRTGHGASWAASCRSELSGIGELSP